MKLNPLHDYIIVKEEEPAHLSTGGIVIPDTATEKPCEGRVVAVGKGLSLANGKVVPPVLKEGDKILFGKYSGTEVTIDGKKLLTMREQDVLAVME